MGHKTQNPISFHEWKEAVDQDDEMEITHMARVTTPAGESLEIHQECLVCWKWKGNRVWFVYANGRITVKNPDEVVLQKMRTIAKNLTATIQGDDGELY